MLLIGFMCNHQIRAIFTQQMAERQISFCITFCIEFQDALMDRSGVLSSCYEIEIRILFDNLHITKLRSQVGGIRSIIYGVTGTLAS